MPSPFPGMDPFIESQSWKDFHGRFVTVLGELLMPQVRPRYVVKVEDDVYVFADSDDPPEKFEPDVYLAEGTSNPVGEATGHTATATMAPTILHLPLPRRHRQRYLVLEDRASREVVTVIEALSPTNKVHKQGRRLYLKKRGRLLEADTNLVELDLLRSGRRLPTIEPLMPADYYAFVAYGDRLPQVNVYAWSLRDRLPTIPVPLAEDDPDATLDLGAALTIAYDRAGYDYALDYRAEVQPPLNDADRDWVRSVLDRRAVQVGAQSSVDVPGGTA